MANSPNKSSYSCSTNGIQIHVIPSYLGHSLPQFPGKHLFTYDITITNVSDVPVQLLRRHWLITDGQGNLEEVTGEGVVGKQPTILPGGSHHYSSFCPISNEIGTMRGTYQMVTADGDSFNAEIPHFPLVIPGARN